MQESNKSMHDLEQVSQSEVSSHHDTTTWLPLHGKSLLIVFPFLITKTVPKGKGDEKVRNGGVGNRMG